MPSRDKDLVNELEAIKTDVTRIRKNLTAELNNLADETRDLVLDNISKERNGLNKVDEETKVILNEKDKADFKVIVNIKEGNCYKTERNGYYSFEPNKSIENVEVAREKAFTTSLTSSRQDLSFHMPIIHSTVITDTSASYNPSNGIFTIPASGVYIFTWAASCGIGCSQDTEFVVDSIAYGCLKVDAVEKQYYGSSIQTVVLEVNKDQRVWIWSKEAGNRTFA
ncbi:unnamed protein product [Mytilus edulis]|uniref:C1q domain-containing protein n=1 Tax=Mytilus edulis TaxID=6550 RepID=A0A8S3UK61_MYTED|nr:unnamed protein product [Mytilus edulis]